MPIEPWRPSRRRILAAGAAATTLLPFWRTGLAQDPAADYPNRAITLLVPYAPAGGTDILARLLGAELARRWKATVVVENRPGAGGQIGNASAARAKPDGYTLLVGITTLIQAPSLYKNLPYDVFKDFTPLDELATSVNFLVVPAESPAQNLKDFLAFAKARQGHLSFGSNGNAGTSHLHGALFDASNQLGMVHVPYSGSGPLLTALLSGQVDCAFVDIAPLRAQLASGKLRVLAGTGVKRSPALPNIPTLGEAGYAGFEPVGWFALFGPAGMPAPVRKKISDAVGEVMQSPEVLKRIDELGLFPPQLSPDAFAASMKEDKPKWDKMIKAGNVSVE